MANKKFGTTYIRKWRHHRGLTLEMVAGRLNMTLGHLSHLERGHRGYTQDTLEAMAAALRTDVASLLMSDPSDPNAIWALWDKAKPEQRRRILEVAGRLVRKAN